MDELQERRFRSGGSTYVLRKCPESKRPKSDLLIIIDGSQYNLAIPSGDYTMKSLADRVAGEGMDDVAENIRAATSFVYDGMEASCRYKLQFSADNHHVLVPKANEDCARLELLLDPYIYGIYFHPEGDYSMPKIFEALSATKYCHPENRILQKFSELFGNQDGCILLNGRAFDPEKCRNISPSDEISLARGNEYIFMVASHFERYMK